jgi:hypothetical protein
MGKAERMWSSGKCGNQWMKMSTSSGWPAAWRRAKSSHCTCFDDEPRRDGSSFPAEFDGSMSNAGSKKELRNTSLQLRNLGAGLGSRLRMAARLPTAAAASTDELGFSAISKWRQCGARAKGVDAKLERGGGSASYRWARRVGYSRKSREAWDSQQRLPLGQVRAGHRR